MCWKIIAIITENARNNTRKNSPTALEFLETFSGVISMKRVSLAHDI
jgi:hypothetical protein